MPTEAQLQNEIFVVDDDALVLGSLSLLLTQHGFRFVGFSDGRSFMDAVRVKAPSCVMLDVHMPGESGLGILKAIDAPNFPAPIFIVSGRGDIPLAVEAIKAGAYDFVEKPFVGSELVERIRAAIDGWQAPVARPVNLANVPGVDRLTGREQEILAEIVKGASNKETARLFGISHRTVEVHRARILEKLGLKRSVDLIRLAVGA